MESILNKGFNFSILPKNIDITQLMIDFNRFKRTILWQEFFYNSEETHETYEKPIFKKVKHNLPKNHKIPEALNVFLSTHKK